MMMLMPLTLLEFMLNLGRKSIGPQKNLLRSSQSYYLRNWRLSPDFLEHLENGLPDEIYPIWTLCRYLLSSLRSSHEQRRLLSHEITPIFSRTPKNSLALAAASSASHAVKRITTTYTAPVSLQGTQIIVSSPLHQGLPNSHSQSWKN